MQKRLLIAGFACVLLLGCALMQKRPKSYYWVEAFQNGKQIGIWKTAPGAHIVEDFGSYKFTAEDGAQVVLTGGNLVVVVHEVKPEGTAPEPTAPAAPPAPAAKPEKQK